MAKEVATTAEDPNAKAVVAGATNALPAFLGERAKEDAGKGTSQDQADNLVPLVYVIQAQSPQANKRGPDYVEGAEAGSLWLRNSGLPAIDGDKGFTFQPCFFYKDWVEWKPARGGYAGRHDLRPAEAVEKNIDPNDPEKMGWVLPNGNIVVETRYHVGIVHLPDGVRMPYVIPLSGSGHTASRAFMFLMNSKSISGLDGPAPSFAALYQVVTKAKSNAKGDWMGIEFKDAGWVQTAEDYERGAKLNSQFASGEKAADVPLDDEASASGGGASAQGENAAM